MSAVINQPRAARGLGIAGAVASILLAAACGGGTKSTAPKVAAIPKSTGPHSAAEGARTPTADTDADIENQRPLIRTDTTEPEKVRLLRTWFSCLKNNGVPTHDAGQGLNKPDVEEDDARYAAAYKTCRSKRPEEYTARIARNDPSAFQDDLTKEIRCMKAKGMPVAANKDHTSLEFTDGRIAQTEEQTKNLNACEKEAFSE